MELKQKVLIIGYVWLEQTSGAGTRMFQLIEVFLKFGYEVVFASAAHKTDKSFDLKSLGVLESSIVLNSDSFDSFIQEIQPDIVMFDRFMVEEQFGWRVAVFCPDAIRVLDTEDLHFLRKSRQECLKKGNTCSSEVLLSSAIAKREVASILRCDLSLIISSYELTLLTDVFNIDSSLLLHLPFLLTPILPSVYESFLNYNDRENFIFVGNFLHVPNVDAVLELKSFWSLIRLKLPKVKVYIYGAYPTQQISELHNEKEGFIVKGYAKDIITEVKKARVVLAPIRFGAGIKGKLVEAMQCGTPSVTTNIGVEGMTSSSEWSGVVSCLDDFATNAVLLYSNRIIWEKSQRKGIDIINTDYDKFVLGHNFIEKIKKLKRNLNNHRVQNFLGSMLQSETLQSKKYMSRWIALKNNI